MNRGTFWDVTPQSPIEIQWCFGYIYCLHLQGRRYAKCNIYIVGCLVTNCEEKKSDILKLCSKEHTRTFTAWFSSAPSLPYYESYEHGRKKWEIKRVRRLLRCNEILQHLVDILYNILCFTCTLWTLSNVVNSWNGISLLQIEMMTRQKGDNTTTAA